MRFSMLDPEYVLRTDHNRSRAAGAWPTFSTAELQVQATQQPGHLVAFSFTFGDERIAGIELIADRKSLERLDVVLLDS
jgi:hypothetical protein